MPLIRRLVPIAAALAIASAAVVGAAASLPVNGNDLAAGNEVVARCDSGGVSVTYVGAPDNVTALTVTQLDSACTGGRSRQGSTTASAGTSRPVRRP